MQKAEARSGKAARLFRFMKYFLRGKMSGKTHNIYNIC